MSGLGDRARDALGHARDIGVGVGIAGIVTAESVAGPLAERSGLSPDYQQATVTGTHALNQAAEAEAESLKLREETGEDAQPDAPPGIMAPPPDTETDYWGKIVSEAEMTEDQEPDQWAGDDGEAGGALAQRDAAGDGWEAGDRQLDPGPDGGEPGGRGYA